MKLRCVFVLTLFAAMVCTQAKAAETVSIDATKKGEAISPYIYGQFIEHLGRCIYGGIWAEMLEDRKFFDAPGAEGSPWFRFGDGVVEMNKNDVFTGEHTPELMLGKSGGYAAIAQKNIAVAKGKKYQGYVWLKCTGEVESVYVVLDHLYRDAVATIEMLPVPVKEGDYYKHEFSFESSRDHDNCQLTISAEGEGSVLIGTVSLMPADNINGMRADTLALLKELDSPVYRWPGGNFVSGYDWNDGIGDRDRRPPRKNPAWQGIEHNDFGMDEFMVFCRYLGTEPYIAVNTGNGEVDNAVAELEYANGGADTPQGKRRAENGHTDGYGVKFWGIGNEMYGDWQIGHMSVEKYAEKQNAFVDAFRAKDPSIKVIAVGAVGKWDEYIMPHCADHMDYISEHFYVGGHHEALLDHVAAPARSIRHIADAHRRYRSEFSELNGKDIRIALDEWNFWYGPHPFGELGTRYFVKDGLGIAAGLHEFFRQSDIIYMANYAQTVNVIGCIKTSKTAAQFETTGLALVLYRKHFGVTPVAVESPEPLDVAAALTADGKTLTVGIVNPLAEEKTLKLALTGVALGEKCVRVEVVGKDPMDYNDPDRPQKIVIAESEETYDAAAGVKVAPYSVTVLKIAVAE